MPSITTFFRHQNGATSADPSNDHTLVPVKAPFTVSASVKTDDTGRLVAVSHSFKELREYDFWLQMQVDGFWVDMPETIPFERLKPREVKGDHIPGGATAPKMYRFTDLPKNTPIRAITTHLEGEKNRGKSGIWGVSITTGTEPRPAPTISPYLT